MSEFKKSLTILASVRDHLCPTLTFPSYHAAPIPILSKRNPSIAILIGRGEAIDSDGSYEIWSPHLVAEFDSKSGEFSSLSSFDANPNSEARQLGCSLAPVAKLDPKYLNLQIQYCQNVDKITAAMFVGESYREQVASLQEQLNEVEPKTLIPYLKALLSKTN